MSIGCLASLVVPASASPEAAAAIPVEHNIISSASTGDDFFDPTSRQEVVVDVTASRTKKQKIILAGLFVGGAMFAGLGGYFHYLSNKDANDVSANSIANGGVYTPQLESIRSRGQTRGNYAIVGYSLGGGLIAAGTIYLLTTQPDSEVQIRQMPVEVSAGAQGLHVGKTWSF